MLGCTFVLGGPWLSHYGARPEFVGAIRMIESIFGWWRSHARGLESLLRATTLAAVAVMLGCAVPGGGITREMSPEARRAAVTERVNARWAALIRGDRDEAYMFLSPASRGAVSLAEFK